MIDAAAVFAVLGAYWYIAARIFPERKEHPKTPQEPPHAGDATAWHNAEE